MTRTLRRVTRGATNIKRADEPAFPQAEPAPMETRHRVVEQPALSGTEGQIASQQRVLVPRLNKAIHALRLISEAGNDEMYGLSIWQKQKLLEILGREFRQFENTIKNGTRGARFITYEELRDTGEEY